MIPICVAVVAPNGGSLEDVKEMCFEDANDISFFSLKVSEKEKKIFFVSSVSFEENMSCEEKESSFFSSMSSEDKKDCHGCPSAGASRGRTSYSLSVHTLCSAF